MKLEAQLNMDQYRKVEEFLEGEENTYKYKWHDDKPAEDKLKAELAGLEVTKFEKTGSPHMTVSVEVDEYASTTKGTSEALTREQIHTLVDLMYHPAHPPKDNTK